MSQPPTQAPNQSVGAENVTNFMLAPGETGVYGQRFFISLLAPYLKGEMMCSTTRFVYKVPKTFLGLIPIGTDENTVPVSAIAAVATSSKFRVGRALLALIFLIWALATFGDSFFGGLILLILAALFAATTMESALVVTNHAGGSFGVAVSVFDSAKLNAFKTELQNRVFADLGQVRHDQAQDLRQQSLMMQQMQLQQMQQAQMQAQQAQMLQQQAQAQALQAGQQPYQVPGAVPPAQVQGVAPTQQLPGQAGGQVPQPPAPPAAPQA